MDQHLLFGVAVYRRPYRAGVNSDSRHEIFGVEIDTKPG